MQEESQLTEEFNNRVQITIAEEEKPTIKPSTKKNRKKSSESQPSVNRVVDATKPKRKPAPKMDQMGECMICCEKYNRSTHEEIKCEYCDFSACRTCSETYLLSNINSKCMNNACDRHWTRKFISDNFTKTFVFKTYKEHRENTLLDGERSKLPAAQRIIEVKKERSQIYRQIRELENQIGQLNRRMNRHHNRIIEGLDPIGIDEDGADDEENGRKTTAQFIQNCSREGCRGFLSTQWKCGICDNYTCSECLEYVGPTKPRTTVEPGATHVCKSENVESARLIKKDTRKCPSCATPIFRVQGCNQMFCTFCNTNFNWVTGLKIDGPIHNPHYFEYMRSRANDDSTSVGGGGSNNQNINNVSIQMEQRCNNMDPRENDRRHQITLNLIYKWKNARKIFESQHYPFIENSMTTIKTYVKRSGELVNILYHIINEMVRTVLHNMEIIDTMRYDHRHKEQQYRLLRVTYLEGNISEDEFKHRIQIIDKKFSKTQENLEVIQMANNVMNDLNNRFMYTFTRFVELSKNLYHRPQDLVYLLPRYGCAFLICLLSNFVEYFHLANFVERCLKDISKTYNNTPYRFHIFDTLVGAYSSSGLFIDEFYFVLSYFFKDNGYDDFDRFEYIRDRPLHNRFVENMKTELAEFTAVHAKYRLNPDAVRPSVEMSPVLDIVDFEILPYETIVENCKKLFDCIARKAKHKLLPAYRESLEKSAQHKRSIFERFLI